MNLDDEIAACIADGSHAPDAESVKHARAFLAALPADLPAPDVGIDSTDCIDFEWYIGPRQTISISTEPDGSFCWASLNGTDGRHGDSTSVDEMVAEIRKVLA